MPEVENVNLASGGELAAKARGSLHRDGISGWAQSHYRYSISLIFWSVSIAKRLLQEQPLAGFLLRKSCR
ncbi:hypothetical protein SARI_00202 [Salmonella enterica subsp. arizonae serovar 62:z4,z23:-]|uniref:Uncharacterized protein n=1 Tax=Salmonella arizonae (strain ATCC BAA-731 / CDC346-86 / RSK2980) TaxID=41514 RepID=A9MG42_SALAR|nr:hypothetical protein SARI_00202 [Salmonella enterica subsp. arizonae serovar 62:z4,z23:-]